MLLGIKGVDDPVAKSSVLEIPNLQSPQVPALMPLFLPLAHVEVSATIRTVLVLSKPVQETLIPFQFFEQNRNPFRNVKVGEPKGIKVCYRIIMEK